MKKIVALLAFLIVGGLQLASVTSKPATKPSEARSRPVQRVVFAAPMENVTGQEQYDPAAAGMGDLVAVLLAQQKHITVVERQRLLALTAEQARSLKGLTGDKYAIRAGKLLKADTVLTGRLFLIKGKLTVSAKVIDIATARLVAADQLSCRPEYLIEAALQMARRLGKQMAMPLPKIDLKKIDKSPIASLHFAKALSHYYAGNMDAAIMQFMRTMDLDPDYIEAHYWSGMAYSRLGEDAHAIIEWKKFLKRQPKSKHAEQVRKMLAAAKAREKDSTVERLGPKKTKPAGTTTKPSVPGPKTKPKNEKKVQADRECKTHLTMAKNYISAGMPEKAKAYLKKIISKHPGTEWSKKAKVLLEKIEKSEK